MAVQTLERKTQSSPAPVASLAFDEEGYRDLMARHLGGESDENRIFFDAFEFSRRLHHGQTRISGEPYISHPCAVAQIMLRELGIKDPTLLAAALLHDIVEDVDRISLEDIEQRFGKTVMELVDGCTKLTRQHLDRATLKDRTHRKIFLKSSRRFEVLVIKLADRLHNMRTLHHLPMAKRQRIAQETVDIYAPLASRLNISFLKRELFRLALIHLFPRKSRKILHLRKGLRDSPEVQEVENGLLAALERFHITASVRIRTKGLGAYFDPFRRTLDLANAENRVDFTIIVDSEDALACYAALGAVHSVYQPIPKTIRDFIANPKGNGYQSLHARCRVGGKNYLMKIRSPGMDHYAKYGVLSQLGSHKSFSRNLLRSVSEFLRTLGEYGGAGPQRRDLLPRTEELFVFTPQGDVHYVPKESVVLDFAYKIHSDLGDHCAGALVNGEGAPPTSRLKEGDTVEIVTSADPMDVDPDLEQLCKTAKARTAINKQLQQKRLLYAEDVGRQILLQELERNGFSKEILEEERTTLILEVLNRKNLSDLFIHIGQDLLSPYAVLYYLMDSHHWDQQPRSRDVSAKDVARERNVLAVAELDKAIHKFARCCSPYPGEEGLLATLSERGITFHHKWCGDVLERHDVQPHRLLDVAWDMTQPWRHPLLFQVHVCDQTPTTLLPSLSRLPANIEIASIEKATAKHRQSCTRITVKHRDFNEAQQFFRCLPSSRLAIESYGREVGLLFGERSSQEPDQRSSGPKCAT